MRIVYWFLLSMAWLTALACRWGVVPALGPLLDPSRGIWNHEPFVWRDHKIPGLKRTVQVAVDKNGVPHFFASNEEDLYLAQGYIVASQRLFQMDVTTRSMSGYLSELIGTKGLKLDRFFTSFGMRQAERELHSELIKNSVTAMMSRQYLLGVNSYIRQLQTPPPEYKIIGVQPREMDTHIISRMAKTMTYSLSGGNPELLLSHLRLTMPVDKILRLFPEFLSGEYEDFVYPGPGGTAPRARETAALFDFQSHIKNFPEIPRPAGFNGSNNWVVGPGKSVTGHSLLANDTHLGLSLPNVWYENQLSCPEFNVYGVSFPSVPGVVNGFNRDIAWGPTNGSTDAIDYYEIEFSDSTSLRYKDGAHWLEAKVFDEAVGGEVVRVLWSKWGPVLYREGRYGLVVNWTGQRASNELAVLRSLYSGKSARACMQSLGAWQVPIQNFVCADQDHIGMMHAGFIAQRNLGEGRFISTPEQTASALTQPVAGASQPRAYDPPVGFLRSANQRIMGPSYPYYMGWNYEEPFRARSIRKQLESKDKLSSADLIALQSDSYSAEAEFILPSLLKSLQVDALTPEQKQRVLELAKWDFRIRAQEVLPTIYKQWYRTLREELFSDEISLVEKSDFGPKDARVAEILRRVSANAADPDAEWVDDLRTKERETLHEIVTRAFQKAWTSLRKDYGEDSSQWIWQRWNRASLPHMAKIPGFGTSTLEMDGSSDSVNGNRGWHGAVYRFVIELGPSVKAWMQVPGGNSGDPFSRDFEKFTREWARGEMREVEFYSDIEEARRRASQVIELSPEGGT